MGHKGSFVFFLSTKFEKLKQNKRSVLLGNVVPFFKQLVLVPENEGKRQQDA